jgi:hypothetical protein
MSFVFLQPANTGRRLGAAVLLTRVGGVQKNDKDGLKRAPLASPSSWMEQ